jgi:DNA phosphorothioation-associated putative methyltransferase
MTLCFDRHRTAIGRVSFSRPMRLALDDGLIAGDVQVLDYGCGRGDDVRCLTSLGIAASGWDPQQGTPPPTCAADVVNLGYVLNVIDDPAERVRVLKDAWSLATRLLVVAARLATEGPKDPGVPHGDGYRTSANTFQRYYEQHELRSFLDDALGAEAIPAGPGVFYVFRDATQRELYLASRYRSARTTMRLDWALLEQHKTVLAPLLQFVCDRGRLPDETEVANIEDLVRTFGSVRRAYRVVQRLASAEEWQRVAAARHHDLLVYLALAKFGRRPRWSDVPPTLQLDIKAFFGSYGAAQRDADTLLFGAGDRTIIEDACRTSAVGKFTPTALYVHESALTHLAPLLRIYEGCARVIIGRVAGANVIKLHHREPRISYLSYPDFDRVAHPALHESFSVHLQTFRVSHRRLAESSNPPILHRKEQFVTPEYPLRDRFAKLTAAEERRGLYANPEFIGTRNGWEQALTAAGVTIRGHAVRLQARRK